MMETRRYPIPCMPAFCGMLPTSPECKACRHRPELDRFHAWQERTAAKPIDPIWSPLRYVATR